MWIKRCDDDSPPNCLKIDRRFPKLALLAIIGMVSGSTLEVTD